MRNRETVGHVTSSEDIAPLDRCTIDGLEALSATRTIIELLGRVDRVDLGNALDSATRKRLTAPSVVERRLGELGRQGRPGTADLDAVLELAGVESWLERSFRRLIAGSGPPTPPIQRTYRAGGRHIARVDFDFAPLPIVVEVGGQRGYMSANERQRQERRRNELQLIGKVIYFFTTQDVRDDPGDVLSTRRRSLGVAG